MKFCCVSYFQLDGWFFESALWGQRALSSILSLTFLPRPLGCFAVFIPVRRDFSSQKKHPLQIGKHITMPYLMMITMCFNYKQNASKSKKQTAHLPAKRRHAREKWLVVIPRHSERWCNKTLFTPHPPPLRHQSPLHSLILPQHSSFLNVTPSGIHKTSSSVPYLFLFGFAGLFDLPWNQNSHSQRLRVLHDWSCTTPVTTSTAFLLFFLSLAVAYCSCKILQEMPKETKLPVRMPFQKETFENNINFVQKMKS